VNESLARRSLDAVALTSPTVWVAPPGQFGQASARGLAEVWRVLSDDGSTSDAAKSITWRHQHREGFGRLVPFSPDLPDFGLVSPLRLWSKSGAYPTVSCEGGLFETDHSTWILAVMTKDVADGGNGSAANGPTLRAEISRLVFEAWSGL
jgi:hypothetical protein